VVTGIPRGATRNGGGLVFGVDGTMYVGTGDTGTPTLGTIVCVDFGRSSPAPAAVDAAAYANDLRWDWSPGQDKRCRSGTCR